MCKRLTLITLFALFGCGDDSGTPLTPDAAVDAPADAAQRPDAPCGDPNTDPFNCGMCGHACAAGEACVGGHCVSNCPTGETFCDGTCVNLQTDPMNCGACTM